MSCSSPCARIPHSSNRRSSSGRRKPALRCRSSTGHARSHRTTTAHGNTNSCFSPWRSGTMNSWKRSRPPSSDSKGSLRQKNFSSSTRWEDITVCLENRFRNPSRQDLPSSQEDSARLRGSCLTICRRNKGQDRLNPCARASTAHVFIPCCETGHERRGESVLRACCVRPPGS